MRIKLIFNYPYRRPQNLLTIDNIEYKSFENTFITYQESYIYPKDYYNKLPNLEPKEEFEPPNQEEQLINQTGKIWLETALAQSIIIVIIMATLVVSLVIGPLISIIDSINIKTILDSRNSLNILPIFNNTRRIATILLIFQTTYILFHNAYTIPSTLNNV